MRVRAVPATRVLAAIVCAAAGAPAQGLSFNFTHDPAMDARAVAGFQAAADRWSANFTSNATITLDIGFTSLGTSLLGLTNTQHQDYTYSVFRSALIQSASPTSADDAIAKTTGLPTTASAFPVYINHTQQNGDSATPYVDPAATSGIGSRNNSRVRVNWANARALGLAVNNPDDVADASITFSNAFSWDFDPADGISPGAYDFVGVATHEIGHALGFGSGVDELDTFPGQSEDMYRATPVDLFRYSWESRDAAAGGIIDLTTDPRGKFFSLDHGVTSIASLATGKTFGDHTQASHWKDLNPPLGIMDPTVPAGQAMVIAELDRRLFDVIGYTRNLAWAWGDTTSSATAYWTNAARWSADGVPDASIDAVFNNGSATGYSVDVNTNVITRAVTVGSDVVTLRLGNYLLSTGQLTVGQNPDDAARLTLAGSGIGRVSAVDVVVGGSSSASGTLVIAAGATLAVSGSLSVSSGAAIDLTGGVLQVSDPSPEEIIDLIEHAFHDGRWDRNGITSSLAAADVRVATGVGYGVDGPVITVRYTWYGDANLDGIVDGADRAALAAGIGAVDALWSEGDFNYDRMVNGDDLALFMVGATYGGTSLFPSVPEPGWMGIAAMVGITAAAGRRRSGAR